MAIYTFRLYAPEVNEREVLIRWSVTPPVPRLYRRTEFRLSFPPQIDLSRVPAALWPRLAMVCLYTHWALLRPCRVRLPFRLQAGERKAWTRLVENVGFQLEAYGDAPRSKAAVELVEEGRALPPRPVSVNSGRPLAAFSGGKDSIVLAGLLADLLAPPTLVTVTSPVPWARDHVGQARDEARQQAARYLGADLVEVASDFRTAWDIGFPGRTGCGLGTHELSDLSLYQAALAAVAAATGRRRVFLASEADIQYNALDGGRVILHPEFLSCAVTQRVLTGLLEGFALSWHSLTCPFHMPQVQALLLSRYRPLAPYQVSCWNAPPGRQSCGECAKCALLAVIALGEGVNPRAVGIDAVPALCAAGDWRLLAGAMPDRPRLHPSRTSNHHLVRAFQKLSLGAVEEILSGDPAVRRDPRLGEALAVWARLRADALPLQVPPAPGYMEAMLGAVPADIRGPLGGVAAAHLPIGREEEFEVMVTRALRLASWILGG